jgi:hypothetical protein
MSVVQNDCSKAEMFQVKMCEHIHFLERNKLKRQLKCASNVVTTFYSCGEIKIIYLSDYNHCRNQESKV